MLLGAIGVSGTKSSGALVQEYAQVNDVQDKSKNQKKPKTKKKAKQKKKKAKKLNP